MQQERLRPQANHEEAFMRISIASTLALLVATQAQAVTVLNGSFETGVAIGPSGIATLATDDTTSLPGWTILADGVDYLDSSYVDASDGSRAVKLTTTSSGGITQRIGGFTAGRAYEIRFDLSSDPNDPQPRPFTSRMIVSATGGGAQLYSYTVTGQNTPTNMLYEANRYRFTAGGEFANIQFRSLNNDEFGAILDNVTIAEVPEPASWALLVLGFGLVGVAARRKAGPVTA
ncbi:hypothetical protein IP88_04585 [alpha proteobacterium AAP81b]|nr:hypothetical protein IP88_04585 [alpha proteobacterium AAP81b]